MIPHQFILYAPLSRQYAGLRQLGETTTSGYSTTADFEAMLKNYNDSDSTESDEREPDSDI